VAAVERLRDRFGAGIVFVPLEAVTDPGLVLAAIGRAAGVGLAGADAPVEALAETFGDGAWLLVLDNLEQVIQAAPDLGELLARCPGVAMLATSRTVLGLRAEREYPVPPLALPADPGTASVAEVALSHAVALFVDRAPSSNITGVRRSASIARETARRSSASSPSVELTNTRRRRSGVRMTGSSRGPWLTDHP
jgi:predicted ATPase